MKISVQYFASVRENLGQSAEALVLPSEVATADQLIDYLVAERGARWREVLRDGKVLVAVNQRMNRLDVALADGDEVAFFPPVTGG